MRSGQQPQLEEALMKWLKARERPINVSINGVILKEKHSNFAA